MYHYGIRGTAYKWFQSYLSNRKQYVTYNGICSSTKDVKYGVPQGSILGPMLCLMYIIALCSICKYTTPILFADDTNLFSSGKDLRVIENHVSDELSNISEWLKVKTISKYKWNSLYDLQQEKESENGQAIDEVNKTKFLGVIIDSKLN